MKKAFTLIEVMVVLSILAIIAILAYNFFGGTMKDAKTTVEAVKLYNYSIMLNDAADDYLRQNGAHIANNSTVNTLVSLGLIRSAPPYPDTVFSTLFVSTWNRVKTVANDPLWQVWYVSSDVCKEFNRRYSRAGATTGYASTASAYAAGETIFCFASGGNWAIEIMVDPK